MVWFRFSPIALAARRVPTCLARGSRVSPRCFIVNACCNGTDAQKEACSVELGGSCQQMCVSQLELVKQVAKERVA